MKWHAQCERRSPIGRKKNERKLSKFLLPLATVVNSLWRLLLCCALCCCVERNFHIPQAATAASPRDSIVNCEWRATRRRSETGDGRATKNEWRVEWWPLSPLWVKTSTILVYAGVEHKNAAWILSDTNFPLLPFCWWVSSSLSESEGECLQIKYHWRNETQQQKQRRLPDDSATASSKYVYKQCQKSLKLISFSEKLSLSGPSKASK